jgi:hypothetical protein
MDEVLRQWRQWLEMNRCLFVVRPPCKPACEFQLLQSPLWGCPGCGRTHYCESSTLAVCFGNLSLAQRANDACSLSETADGEYVCTLTHSVAVAELRAPPPSASYKVQPLFPTCLIEVGIRAAAPHAIRAT